MQRASESISKIAIALAKAQAELENPEKSLVAIIPSPFANGESRSFRYASLASGLEIVRKCLSRHEIAAVQATAIDRESGLINLTTTLVHGSGEWIASDWPVCAVTETGAPHRMGAALTYARRYALFTLVGIAGEDDLDAPDLTLSAGPINGPNSPAADQSILGSSHQPKPGPPASRSSKRPRARSRTERPNVPVLAPDASTRLRNQLIAEIEPLSEAEDLTAWSYRSLPLKNKLSNADALAVEAAFEAKLTKLERGTGSDQKKETAAEGDREPIRLETVVILTKPTRERDRHHLRFVSTQPCLICGRTPSDAHHIKYAEQRAMGRKVSDKFTVPLCRLHHRELHRRGNERAWWHRYGIEPLGVAATLWKHTHAVQIPAVEELDADAGSNGASFRADLVVKPQDDETNAF